MMRKETVTVALAVMLVGSAISASATEPPRTEEVVVQADYIGVSVNGESLPGGVTYTLEPDGSTVTLWASSADALDEGETALFIGNVTADQQAEVRTFLSSGVQASNRVVCTVWAEDPTFDAVYEEIDGVGYHWCSGPWKKHKLIGKLQWKWGFIWRTGDTYSTGWEYEEQEIQSYPFVGCENEDRTKWRNRSTGYVQANDGRRSIKSHNSEGTITEYCGT